MSTEAVSLPRDDPKRLAAIDHYGVIDLEYGPRFERVLRIAARVFDVSVAVLTVVTERDTIIKAAIGSDAQNVPRGEGVCETVIERDEFVHHQDVQRIPELSRRKYSEGIGFYAGMPIRSPSGYALGTLCIANGTPRSFDERDFETLRDLAETVTDLLAHHRAERDRDETLERLRIVSQAPNILIVEVDDQGFIQHASPSVIPMTGYTPTQLEGRFFLDFVHERGRARLAEDYATAIRGEYVEGEADFVIHDGSVRTLAWSTCPATAPNGKPCTVSVMRDVSERVRVQQEIAIAQERYQQLFETSCDPMALARADRTGEILEANGAFSELFGYARDELVGKPLAQIRANSELAREEMLQKYDELMTRGYTDEYERDFLTRDGESIPVSVCAWMLRDPNGHAISILTRLRDIRAERERDRLQSQLQEELEERVRARTHELEETLNRLKTAERLASVGTLASGVAHQINNPIGAILAASEFALMCESEEGFKETWRRALMDAVEQSKRCGRIVRSMLQYSRGTRTERWPEDLSLVVPRAIRIVESQTRHESVGVQFRCAASNLLVMMNPIEMEQVLVNVIENAVEAVWQNGEVSVRVSAEGDDALIEVVDDGEGIPEQARRRVFDPFYTTRQEQGGTGLGLSVADGIVRDLGGDIQMREGPLGGTRVTIALPLHRDTSQPS